MKKYLYYSLLALAPVLIASNPANATATCSELVTLHCLSCHSETRICQKIDKKRGKRAWKRTIKAMIRHGANIDKSTRNELIECLGKKADSLPELCGTK